jgi:Multiubiquitin
MANGQDNNEHHRPDQPGGGPGNNGGDHGGGNPGSGGGDHGGGNPDPGGAGHGGGHSGHGEKITFLVNEKPVTIDKAKQTGLSIKQAAIAQGVQIQIDFVLSIERGGGKTELIGDGDEIKVRDGDRFLAIPNDDNS